MLELLADAAADLGRFLVRHCPDPNAQAGGHRVVRALLPHLLVSFDPEPRGRLEGLRLGLGVTTDSHEAYGSRGTRSACTLVMPFPGFVEAPVVAPGADGRPDRLPAAPRAVHQLQQLSELAHLESSKVVVPLPAYS